LHVKHLVALCHHNSR